MKMTFKELANIQNKILSEQKPTTLSKARRQVKLLKELSSRTTKKQRLNYFNY